LKYYAIIFAVVKGNSPKKLEIAFPKREDDDQV
jgi:hypothetical protein